MNRSTVSIGCKQGSTVKKNYIKKPKSESWIVGGLQGRHESKVTSQGFIGLNLLFTH